MKSHYLVKKACNSSSNKAVKDVVEKILEYGIFLIRGDKYLELLKYLDVLDDRYDMLKEIFFNMTNIRLRNAHINKLEYYR